jgi:hypothetical protein
MLSPMQEASMNRPCRFALSCLLSLATSWTVAVGAQVIQQRTPMPTATADGATWYMNREPILFAGNVYYPAGVQVNFNGNEMVRSGYFDGVPLYSRTTIEPYSIVFVPLHGGLMQPYERPRTGDVAGTVGSTAPSFPVSISAVSSSVAAYQAPGAPPQLMVSDDRLVTPVPTSTLGTSRVVTEPVGMAGAPEPPPTVAVAPVPLPAPGSIRRRPSRIFITFGGERYFTSGVPVTFDAARFVRLGDHHGFPVYAEAQGSSSTIYIPVSSGLAEVVAPYVRQGAR